MLAWAVILLLSVAGRALCADSAERGDNGTLTVSDAEETSESISQPVTESLPTDVNDVTPAAAATAETVGPTFRVQGSSRAQRRRPRRPRGYYNDIRYRNPANNPYNPNSPYAFRGRPGQPPPVAPRQQQYSDPYYDPYSHYYGYQGYSPVQQPYYSYPYQNQAQQPTPAPTETIPDLYYVQKADSPDGQYQYKKVSVVPDSYLENRGRRRPTRWAQHYSHPAGAYYNYPYDPYERRPPPPPPQYYQSYQYQYPDPRQYPPYYQYPKVPGGPRSRLRGGRAPLHSTPSPTDWRLTLAPFTTPSPTHSDTDTGTEPSGD